jgi:hypothetical protein
MFLFTFKKERSMHIRLKVYYPAIMNIGQSTKFRPKLVIYDNYNIIVNCNLDENRI